MECPPVSTRPIVSSFARSVQPSATLALTARAEELRRQGADVVVFGAGQPDFGPEAPIVQDVVDAVRRGCDRYTPTAGTPELRAAIAASIRERRGVTIRDREVVVTVGAKQALLEALLVLAEPGSDILFPSPYWVSYPEMARIARARPVPVPCDPSRGWRPDLDALDRAMGPRTSVVILNSPCNPTGAIFPPEDLDRILAMAHERGIGVVSDEIYEQLLYDGSPHAPSILDFPPSLRERAVCVGGVSKTYGMTGWRIGWAVGPAEVLEAMARIQDHVTSNPAAASQAAALAAVRRPQAHLGERRRSLDERRRRLLHRIAAIPGLTVSEPLGAFYAFPRIDGCFGRVSAGGSPIEDSHGFCEALLQEAHVGALPGAAFGEDRGMRLSYCVPRETLDEGLDRIERFVKALRPAP